MVAEQVLGLEPLLPQGPHQTWWGQRQTRPCDGGGVDRHVLLQGEVGLVVVVCQGGNLGGQPLDLPHKPSSTYLSKPRNDVEPDKLMNFVFAALWLNANDATEEEELTAILKRGSS